jgi:hypothetical protein
MKQRDERGLPAGHWHGGRLPERPQGRRQRRQAAAGTCPGGASRGATAAWRLRGAQGGGRRKGRGTGEVRKVEVGGWSTRASAQQEGAQREEEVALRSSHGSRADWGALRKSLRRRAVMGKRKRHRWGQATEEGKQTCAGRGEAKEKSGRRPRRWGASERGKERGERPWSEESE